MARNQPSSFAFIIYIIYIPRRSRVYHYIFYFLYKREPRVSSNKGTSAEKQPRIKVCVSVYMSV